MKRKCIGHLLSAGYLRETNHHPKNETRRKLRTCVFVCALYQMRKLQSAVLIMLPLQQPTHPCTEPDDIIRLKKKEQRNLQLTRFSQGKPRMNWKLQPGWPAPPIPRTAWRGTQQQRGLGINRLGVQGKKLLPAVGKRRAQGMVTWLAARKPGVLRKGISPLNRPAFTQMRAHPGLQRRMPPYTQTDAQRRQLPAVTGPVEHRRNVLPASIPRPAAPPLAAHRPPAHQTQKELRQATFLSRRGLKVQTHLPTVQSKPPITQRTRQWRTSTTDGGILTVSIDNPTARIVPPDPPRPRVLRPPMPPAPLKLEEKKVPKGVPLEFDISSMGKQTALTLNERFKILKDQRTAVAQSKGNRFVTVG
ncbi:UAP56-interacting factor-like isoform X2 [Polyodon spathula]|uniref:UAP56-interacting factor-like isoform X2 n=1 Tax=Polyodon spathula TaxID=7913 RepID=UPI001B7EEE9B|nr:UAP56-interacting factor-like isoform X2 [Polyodon spathula]